MAKREASKTEDDIYEEVFIDEVNQELLKNVQKQDGQIVIVLCRQERLKKFSDVWRQANLDFYNTQTSIDRKLRKQAANIVDEKSSDQETVEEPKPKFSFSSLINRQWESPCRESFDEYLINYLF